MCAQRGRTLFPTANTRLEQVIRAHLGDTCPALALTVGLEVIAGSTRLKSSTTQKMILNRLSTANMSGQKLARRTRGILSTVTGLSAAAKGMLRRVIGNGGKD